MTERIVIGDLPRRPLANFTVDVGETLADVLARLGAKPIRIEHVPPPTELQVIARRAQEVGDEVSALLRICRTAEDVPAPDHLPRPDDDCTICDARRIVADMLAGR